MKNLQQFCDEWLEAWTGNRPEYLMSFYSHDAFYRDPAHPIGLKGHEQILPYFKKLLAANPSWVWKALNLYPTENGFVLRWVATVPLGMRVVSEIGMDIVELEMEKITRNEVYFDPAQLKETSFVDN